MRAPGVPAGHVVLVGMMGAGKTTTGRRLAAALRRPFVDSDAMIEARTGRKVREIFEADGEQAFRALESAALVEALAASVPSVVAAAGGVVLDPSNRRALAGAGAVVWLRAEPDFLVARVGRGTHRPLLATDAAAALRRLDEERRPLYAEVADAVVDIDRMAPGQVLDAVLRALHPHRPPVRTAT